MAKKPTPKASPSSPVRGVDLPEIEKLLDFMRKHGLEEFEYERQGFRIRLKKPSSPAYAYPSGQAPEIVVASAAPHASLSNAPACETITTRPTTRTELSLILTNRFGHLDSN